MKAHTLLTKAAAGLGTVALALTLSACSHNKATEGQDYGQIRTEEAAQQQATSAQTVGTAPAPSNAANVETGAAPAVISGPAKVDTEGRAYTSSSAGGTGNASVIGLNTNVNIIPETPKSTVTVTEVPAPTVVETTVVETPVVEAPVIETPPMVSSTTVETQTTTTTEHRRMRKD
jgi:hypothetical protein